MMLLEQFDHMVAKDMALLYDWTRTKFLLAWPRDWTTFLLLRKILYTLHFHLCRLLKQHVSDCARYRAN